MQIIINGQTINLPSSASEVTTEQRKEFYEQHGKELDKMLLGIVEMEDPFEKEMELVVYKIEKMFRVFAFFTGCTVQSIKESEFIDDLASIYTKSGMRFLLEDNNAIEKHLTSELFNMHEPDLNGDDLRGVL